jgi:alpha-galactosidase
VSIEFIQNANHFHLKTPTSSYIIAIKNDRYLEHVQWGSRINAWSGRNASIPVDRPFAPNPVEGDRNFSLDTLPQEYSFAGHGDFREPAVEIAMPDGTLVMDAWYAGHRIFAGKPKLEGLPATWVADDAEADTLEIDLTDKLYGIAITLSYTVWKNRDVISRSTRIVNAGTREVSIRKAMSACVDFGNSEYSMLQLSGAHCRERGVITRRLVPGIQGIESRRGASSHQQNPFIALLAPGSTESTGEVFAFNLVYSGNFSALIDVDQYGSARTMIGINPHNFAWMLEPGKSFQTPEVVMARSENGLGEVSRTLHRLYRERLCRGTHQFRERPVVINSWEAIYFNFDEKKLLELAEESAKLGVELFVLDDGWFGKRDSDTSSLGDWTPDKRKLPNGLRDFSKKIKAKDLAFGIWVEPEMISRNSDLFRSHPDWPLQVPGRDCSFGRDQLVLDLSRKDVRDYLFDALSGVFTEAEPEYVKWDMNRHMTEVHSATLAPRNQQEVSHRYMLGLYELLERLTAAFPDILFESCSGGGGRYDPGMLYYMPQTWTSDNIDSLNRVSIQFGTSIAYPASTMSCHVSAAPNHQSGRITTLKSRGDIAMAGTFGYELDVTKITAEEKEAIKKQIARYRKIRQTVLFGDLYRLRNPVETETGADSTYAAWMHVSPDRKDAVVTAARLKPWPNQPPVVLRLAGLSEDAIYLSDFDGNVYGGRELMTMGIKFLFLTETEESVQIRLTRVEKS